MAGIDLNTPADEAKEGGGIALDGVYVPIATPFDGDDNVSRDGLRHNFAKWNRTGLKGYSVCGSTGESVYLTTEEKLRLWEWAAEFAAPDKLLIAGTGMESVRETVDLTNRAARLGYRLAMVRTPHYYKNLLNNVAAQVAYFTAVADQAKIPLMIYNWPQATSLDIAAEAVARLSAHPNVIAIKESSGSLEKVMQMIREARPGFQVLVGSAPTLWPSLLVGSPGAVLAFANAAPNATVAVWQAHREGNMEAGLRTQARIARAAWLVTVKHGVPGLKFAMDLNGYRGGAPRLPLAPPSAEAQAEIRAAFEGLD